ncbi:MAG: ATP-binding cassette domain-containing protein [Spirochaetales bacterium]|nr:ATP-binding cassette domain-containing protein [Spirochaetales bacterium]
MPKKQYIFELKNADVIIKDKYILKNINISIKKNEITGVYGANGSGKTLLSDVIGGKRKLDNGERVFIPGAKVSVVSSIEQQRMLERDRYNDDSEFIGKEDPGRSVRTILGLAKNEKFDSKVEQLIKTLQIEHILDRGIKYLSTGEFRKMMIADAVIKNADIIILDDPYTGLDRESRKKLILLINELKELYSIIVVSGRLEDMQNCERYFLLEGGQLSEYQTNDDLKKKVEAVNANSVKLKEPENFLEKKEILKEELIRLDKVSMSYYGEKILTDISWSVVSAEHWQIIGPNGSGKSSLISLINGDSPKAYGQNLYLFGNKRGSGETVWDIKQKIGLVSGSLQRMHRSGQNVLSIVLSGYFDTIGLYDKPTPIQINYAKTLCEDFGLEDIIQTDFDKLSEGLKRTVLIIRALIKTPKLLILDEPCQGLDDHNSSFIVKTASNIIKSTTTTLIYVSHDPYYQMDGINKTLNLVPHKDGGYTGEIKLN